MPKIKCKFLCRNIAIVLSVSFLCSFSMKSYALRNIKDFYGDKLVVGCGHNWAEWDDVKKVKKSHQLVHPKHEYYAIDIGDQEGQIEPTLHLIDESVISIMPDLFGNITKSEDLVSIPNKRFNLILFEYLPFNVQFDMKTLSNIRRIINKSGSLVIKTFIKSNDMKEAAKALNKSGFCQVKFKDMEFENDMLSGYQTVTAKRCQNKITKFFNH